MTLMKKNFENPDVTQSPPYVKADTIKIGEMTVVKQCTNLVGNGLST